MRTVRFFPNDVSRKRIETTNDFVSHMLEHIAWRMGTGIEVVWSEPLTAQTVRALGAAVGRALSTTFSFRKEPCTVFGMIDDGGAIVSVKPVPPYRKGSEFTATPNVSLRELFSLRVEQVPHGQMLVDLLDAIARELPASITVTVTNDHDMHHTWEAVYRGVGSALGMLRVSPPIPHVSYQNNTSTLPMDSPSEKLGVYVSFASYNRAVVVRKTAETCITIDVDFTRDAVSFSFPSHLPHAGFETLLHALAKAGGFGLRVTYAHPTLASTHVLAEDTGLLLGRALFEVLKIRMDAVGVEGWGDNLEGQRVLPNVIVGISVEGRKTLTIESLGKRSCRSLLRGNTIAGTFSEDLDDFFDGLAGGLHASIIINIRKWKKGADEEGWNTIFDGAGRALRHVFSPNPLRKGLPPGVKATLA